MSRIDAREGGFKLVFEYLFNKEPAETDFLEEFKLLEEEKDFSLSIFDAVKTNFDTLDQKLAGSLKNNLKLKDIYQLDHAILLSTMAQIDYLKEPIALAINEGVRMAKKYSTEKSPSFINGVLSTIYKEQ